MISKKRSSLKFSGIFRPRSKIQTIFLAENRWSPKKKGFYPKNVMKFGVSPQKLRNYRWQTPIWASICTPVAPSLLISSEHSPRLGGHSPRMPPVAPGLSILLLRLELIPLSIIVIVRCYEPGTLRLSNQTPAQSTFLVQFASLSSGWATITGRLLGPPS